MEPTRLSRRACLVLFGGGAAAGLLAACGGAASVSTGASAAAVSSSAPAATSAVASVSGTGSAPTTSASVTSQNSTTQAASAGATASTAATGSAAPVSSAAAKPATNGVTVTWWSGWGSSEQDAFAPVATAANQAGLGFTSVHTAQNDAATKLATTIAAGTPPDMEVGNLAYPEFWASGSAIPLDGYLATSTIVKKADLLDASWAFGTYQGKVYGVPAGEAFVRWGLVANVDLLQKRGLDPANLPTTWDDLFDWHTKLTVLDPSTKAITQLGLDPISSMGGSMSGGDPFFSGPSFGLGAGYYNEGAATFDLVNTPLENALANIKRFYDAAGGYQAIQAFRKTNGGWTGAKSGIALGTEAMQINGYWAPGSLAHSAPTKKYVYGWPPVSADRKGTTMQSTGGHFAVLPKGAPHPDQAFAMAAFLTTETAERILLNSEGFLGARKSFLTKIDPKQYPGLDWYLQSPTGAKELWADPVDPIEGFFADNWATTRTKVLQGTLTPKDALGQLQQVVTAHLAQQLGKG
jgi:multiple sugar transport system substrate-binding protein